MKTPVIHLKYFLSLVAFQFPTPSPSPLPFMIPSGILCREVTTSLLALTHTPLQGSALQPTPTAEQPAWHLRGSLCLLHLVTCDLPISVPLMWQAQALPFPHISPQPPSWEPLGFCLWPASPATFHLWLSTERHSPLKLITQTGTLFKSIRSTINNYVGQQVSCRAVLVTPTYCSPYP